ncbi:MAG: PorP/SprF family type IX secretion system membrane protein [Crocinitomicaceae bacterium]|nr:PorP/SprF family type IX secretion system membrane protein [Crocinitomicaceae bacterium]
MRRILLGALLLTSLVTSAQDIHFSQMSYSPLTLNPGLAGANYDLTTTLSFRSQWNSVAEPFQTVAFSVDSRLNAKKKRNKKAHFAAGINFFNDRAGEAKVITNNANLHLSTHIILDYGHTLGLGLYGGWLQRTLNPNGGRWANQYDGMQYNEQFSSGETFNTLSFSNFDTGAGLVYTFYNGRESRIAANDSKMINIGFAAYHLNRPGYSFVDKKQERLYMRFSAFANASFGIRNTHVLVEPGVYFHNQGNARELFFGMYWKYILKGESHITNFVQQTMVGVGLFCRNQDALVIKAMFEWNGIGIGFAYDFNLFNSMVKMSKSRGGIEVALRWVVPDLYKSSSRIK